jgi:hypothetical protein
MVSYLFKYLKTIDDMLEQRLYFEILVSLSVHVPKKILTDIDILIEFINVLEEARQSDEFK